jgi:hypothetical protein
LRNGGVGTMFAEHPRQRTRTSVRPQLPAAVLFALMPALAWAEGAAQPKYPPGFDCSAVAAGSQRQACNRSHLDPPMGAVEQPKRAQPDSLVRQPNAQPLPTAKPPTIPRLPGTIDPGN